MPDGFDNDRILVYRIYRSIISDTELVELPKFVMQVLWHNDGKILFQPKHLLNDPFSDTPVYFFEIL
jgi:hypothetical protein